mmetsp:Transcript_13841/g.17166  ORF Transcript_13841/g.17166 Transcript_13841/m.17166 type:complete len:407 (-) Transcript_13841:279-1499(-)
MFEKCNELKELRKELQMDLDGYASWMSLSLPSSELESEVETPATAPMLLSDVRMYRFLQGNGYDVSAAATAFRKMLEWRKSNNIEKDLVSHFNLYEMELKQSKLPNAKEINLASGSNGPWYDAGRTHDGHVVHIEVIGSGDPSAMIETVSEQKIIQHHMALLELRANVFDRLSVEQGKVIKSLQIRDLSLFGLHLVRHSGAMSLLGKIMKFGSNNYPESAQKAFFINTPPSFYVVWKVIQTFIRKETLEKTVFLDKSYHRELLKYVPVRIIHNMEYLTYTTAETHHDAVDTSRPANFVREISASAGSQAELFVYMTREKRNKVHIKFTECDPLPKAVILTSSPGEVNEQEISLGAVVDPNSTGFSHQITLSYPEGCHADECLLSLFVDNTESWIQSKVVKFHVKFL